MAEVAVLLVCLGNICRSPTAEGVLRSLTVRHGLADCIRLDSAGTGDWHLGKPPHRQTQAAAAARGYDLSPLRARQIERTDFSRFDYILAMDRDNLADIQALRPQEFQGHLGLFLDFLPNAPLAEVPDPYGGGEQGFIEVLDLVERGAEALLKHLRSRL